MTSAPATDVTLEFTTDPAAFLEAAGAHLAADPMTATVVASNAARRSREAADGLPGPEHDWWVTVRDASGAVISAAMRTAPFSPRPLFLLPMTDQAALALARSLHARGEEALGFNGALPAVQVCAEETARLVGGRVEVAQHTRLHEYVEPTPPRAVPGRLVVGTEDDLELATAWFHAFAGDADEQAGRPAGTGGHAAPARDDMLRRLRAGRVWFWEDAEGRKVHLTGVNPPSFGVARIGPVYTPSTERGKGWASAAVAEVSDRILADGARATLFTDQANPTSNKIYAAIGYRPLVDMANLLVVRD